MDWGLLIESSPSSWMSLPARFVGEFFLFFLWWIIGLLIVYVLLVNSLLMVQWVFCLVTLPYTFTSFFLKSFFIFLNFLLFYLPLRLTQCFCHKFLVIQFFLLIIIILILIFEMLLLTNLFFTWRCFLYCIIV